MDTNTLARHLVRQTILQCGHEERKGQLSMSWLSQDVPEIVRRVRHGDSVAEELKLKLYHGTWAEVGMRARIEAACKELGVDYGGPQEIRAFGGRLTGHIDCTIGDSVCEIKTVPSRRELDALDSRMLPLRVFWQVQAYMLWGQYDHAFIVYEERATGFIRTFECAPNKGVRAALANKVTDVFRALGEDDVGD